MSCILLNKLQGNQLILLIGGQFMLVNKGKKNKNLSRPKKTGVRLRRRLLEHRRKLIELGFSEEEVKLFTRKDMLSKLKNPKKTKTSLAKSSS